MGSSGRRVVRKTWMQRTMSQQTISNQHPPALLAFGAVSVSLMSCRVVSCRVAVRRLEKRVDLPLGGRAESRRDLFLQPGTTQYVGKSFLHASECLESEVSALWMQRRVAELLHPFLAARGKATDTCKELRRPARRVVDAQGRSFAGGRGLMG